MSENVTAYAPYDSAGNRMPLACPVEYLYDENGYGAGERRFAENKSYYCHLPDLAATGDVFAYVESLPEHTLGAFQVTPGATNSPSANWPKVLILFNDGTEKKNVVLLAVDSIDTWYKCMMINTVWGGWTTLG